MGRSRQETALALVRRLLALTPGQRDALRKFAAIFRGDGQIVIVGAIRPLGSGSHDRCERMSKQSMREEAERLIRETMARKAIVVKQGNTRIETTCGKCGAPNRISAAKGATRVKFACKECGHKQETL
jgi:hypothetical protein